MLIQIVNDYQLLGEKGVVPLLLCQEDKSRLYCSGDIDKIVLFCLECDTKISLGQGKYDVIKKMVEKHAESLK